MIRVIIATAREAIQDDDDPEVYWDTPETLDERVNLRARVEAWNKREESAHYPAIQVFRDLKTFKQDMVAWMDFETEEEAVMFKLTYPEI